MAHDIFVSYSSKDQAAAESICKALEDAKIPCWIAPRDISSGTGWGGSIVGAIQASKAVLIVFSEHANQSPQVVREMESAVAKRLPLIPVRVAGVMPTADMEYFLGVSHWFDAYPKPLETYLPQIVASVKGVLGQQAAPWQRFVRRLPQSRTSQLTAAGGALLAAIVTAWLMRPAEPKNPMLELQSTMTGRWQSEIKDAAGRKFTCIMDVQSMGQTTFSDSCPQPLAGATVNVASVPTGTYAPRLFVPGQDTGTYLMMGGTVHGLTGSFRVDGSKRLITNDSQGGEVTWKKIKADHPLQNAADSILPAHVDWPLRNVPGIASRAVAYARSKWQSDAVLMSAKFELLDPNASLAAGAQSPAGGVQVQFELYSPGTQQGMVLMPGSMAGTMFPTGAVDRNPRQALPTNFVDLPDAVAALQASGMRAKQIKKAELENWQAGTSYGYARLSGVEWMIDSALGERGTVPALRQ